jgi:trimethylamine monooxygenase
MYRYLWSNGPKECLEFADYTFDEHFGRPVGSFPPRAVLRDYIAGRAAASGVRRLIQFGTAVRWVSYDPDTATFAVTVQARADGRTRTEQFDKVIVATGSLSSLRLCRTFGGGRVC